MMILVACFAQEVVVVALDRIDPLRSLDHGEVHLLRDARDFREHLAPVWDQVKHVVRRRDVEGPWAEWKVRAFRDDDVSKAFREAKFDQIGRASCRERAWGGGRAVRLKAAGGQR